MIDIFKTLYMGCKLCNDLIESFAKNYKQSPIIIIVINRSAT